VEIYVAAVEALRNKKRQMRIDGFLSFTPLNAKLFLNLTLCMTKLRVLVLCFPYFTDKSNKYTILYINSLCLSVSRGPETQITFNIYH
jgi:hypothetical protein